MEKFTDHELAQELRRRGNAVVLWSVDDVLLQAENNDMNITVEQAQDIVNRIDESHDANHGISWETIDFWLFNLILEKDNG